MPRYVAPRYARRFRSPATVLVPSTTLSVVQNFNRPSVPAGITRLWPGNGYFIRSTFKQKVKSTWGTNYWYGVDGTSLSVDGMIRSDTDVYCGGVAGGAEVWYYQNVPLKPADGCDVVVTEAYALTKRTVGAGTLGEASDASVGVAEPDFPNGAASEIISQHIPVELDWGDRVAKLDKFLFAGNYALFVWVKGGTTTGWVEDRAAFLEFRYYHVKLTMTPSKTTIPLGDTVTFSGKLTVKDSVPPSTTVTIYGQKAGESTSRVLAMTSTSSTTGEYSCSWKPTSTDVGNWTVHAEATVSGSGPVTIASRPVTLNATTAPAAAPFPWTLVAAAAGGIGVIAIAVALAKRK